MKSNKKKIAIVIVNYHNSDETVDCVHSFDQLKKDDLLLQFYVVDNGGTPKSTVNLAKKLPQAKIINSSKNIGFAGGSNLAIRQALKEKTDYLLLMNPDTKVETKDFWPKMLRLDADITSPLIQYLENHQLTYDYGGQVDYLFGRNRHYTARTPQTTLSHQPDYFTGACLLIKAAVFKEIGFLDDGFFLYYEDADFCLRAVKAGFVQKLCPQAHISHLLSTTTSQIGKRKIIILADSHLRFCRKHLSLMSAPFYLAFNLYLRFKARNF